jgi:hypothetical protein
MENQGHCFRQTQKGVGGCSIVAFSFIDGGNWITLKKPSTLVTKKLYNVESRMHHY